MDIGNAADIHKWHSKDNLIKVLIITSDYHILRAVETIQHSSPNLHITPYAVDSKHRSSASSRWLIFAEYNKFLFVWLKNSLN